MNPTDWVIRNIRRQAPETLVVQRRFGNPGWLVCLVLWDGGYVSEEIDAVNAAHLIHSELSDVAESAHKSMSLDTPQCEHCHAPIINDGAPPTPGNKSSHQCDTWFSAVHCAAALIDDRQYGHVFYGELSAGNPRHGYAYEIIVGDGGALIDGCDFDGGHNYTADELRALAHLLPRIDIPS